MSYMLTRFENGSEVIVCYGNSYEGMRKTVENSPGVFMEGYAIYEMNLIECNHG